MRRRIMQWLLNALRFLQPKPDLAPTLRNVTEIAAELARRNDPARQAYMERVSELIEARQMMGSGPWVIGPGAAAQTDAIIESAYKAYEARVPLRETLPLSAGAYGDIDLALQNVEWRREVQTSWLEFSRWGIQQIILISRLYYIKNPIIRRLVDVCAAYVFARGVEISSPDESVNDEIQAFLQDNRNVLGHSGLTKAERRKDYDGNLFFVIFSDKANSGRTTVRLIDATEIQDIETDPEDTDTPWYYHRICSQRVFDPANGSSSVQTVKSWYPALGYDPPSKPQSIGGEPVMWESPVYHSKCGEVGKWHFGCPRIYPALDWAKEARKYLEACASVKQSNAQVARDITTKGGQQAIEGIKAQMSTTVGPTAAIWDQNPPAAAGATWVHGPGMEINLQRLRGMSDDPEEVRRYLLMCCMVAGVPETFLGDVSTGNLATATSLDRPTETIMLEKQEAWREDLICIVQYALNVSLRAPRGRLREAMIARGIEPGAVTIRECRRVPSKSGSRMVYATLDRRKNTAAAWQLYEADRPVPAGELLVRVNFPAIREGDLKMLVDATIEAMTLGNRAGQVTGIDEKAGVRHLYDLLDFEDGDELTEDQYPEGSYEIDRTKQEVAAPIPPARTLQPGQDAVNPVASTAVERAMGRLERAIESYKRANGEPNGIHHH